LTYAIALSLSDTGTEPKRSSSLFMTPRGLLVDGLQAVARVTEEAALDCGEQRSRVGLVAARWVEAWGS
jgi:hypothetical protein